MYICNVSFLFSNIDTGSLYLCNYVNYHVIMLAVCGSISTAFMLMALFALAFYVADSRRSDLVERCVKWALIMCILSLGFDGAFALFFIILFVAIFFVAVYFCFMATQWVVFHMACQLVPRVIRRSNAVVAVEMGAHDVQVVVFSSDFQCQCPICLEMDNGPWCTTRCGHVFHPVCIKKWPHNTCPMCRSAI